MKDVLYAFVMESLLYAQNCTRHDTNLQFECWEDIKAILDWIIGLLERKFEISSRNKRLYANIQTFG